MEGYSSILLHSMLRADCWTIFEPIKMVEGLGTQFWDLKGTTLHKICISGTVRDPLLTQKYPTLHTSAKNCASGICGSESPVNAGP